MVREDLEVRDAGHLRKSKAGYLNKMQKIQMKSGGKGTNSEIYTWTDRWQPGKDYEEHLKALWKNILGRSSQVRSKENKTEDIKSCEEGASIIQAWYC